MSASPDRGRAAATSVGRALVPVLLAFVVGGVVLAVTGQDPLQIYRLLLEEAFGGGSRIDATLAAATPLLFTAVAAAFAYRAGVFTIGAEGSFTLGGLAAAVVGAHVGSLPPVAAVGSSLLAAVAAGVLVAVVPAVLRAWWKVDEVVTTLMFNFIVAGVAGWAVQAFFQERGQANSATAYVSDAARLEPFFPPNLTNAGLVVALLLVVAYAFWFRRTTLGFEFRAVGATPRFAVAQGLRTRTVVVVALLGAGLVAGLGGGVHALGIVHRYTGGFSASFGFTGIAIALLARFNPVGMVVGAVLFGALNAAGSTIQLFVNLPIQLVDILQGTVMIFAVVQFVLPRLALRRRPAAPEAVIA
ncbi:ABC transporter permease [Cellulomonas hominis]|uniref:ABC transporter permease n=1 Tax=Cellulomonas hominis TaxID=156981 RepID=A0A511FFK8_9CELL|nr:ABC transporter permease [Cellulomonas hominis]MBB5473322.1 simple sugar transport system permease protein [Cellulomonas hominis]MBU5421252.1 ABC transporter permease [Cellulomonas hominis]NKY06311.1 ABC transporter permease [Cellulomonas hominis]NKY09639.1 ABC transporter permease [Cellulomonas hominis]GEL48030.1 ABC transporter permease [Cellulomonas hominis]